MTQPYTHHLSSRLTAAEHYFLHAQFDTADAGALDVVRDLISLGSSGSSRRLTRREHTCVEGCVCEAAIILHIQCSYELGRSEAFVREHIVERYYGEPAGLTYAVFNVWIQYQLSYRRYEQCCSELIAYIDANFSPQGSYAVMSGDVLVENDRYLALLELLLFHVLVPLKSHDEAIHFLRKGKKAPIGRRQQRDERITEDIKEVRNRTGDRSRSCLTHCTRTLCCRSIAYSLLLSA
jgi:hypothetical protein